MGLRVYTRKVVDAGDMSGKHHGIRKWKEGQTYAEGGGGWSRYVTHYDRAVKNVCEYAQQNGVHGLWIPIRVENKTLRLRELWGRRGVDQKGL